MKAITSVNRIIKLASMRRSVYVLNWKRRTSASFLLGMPLRSVYLFVKQKQLYE